jgi:uncharacterized protein (TIGR03437 family)
MRKLLNFALLFSLTFFPHSYAGLFFFSQGSYLVSAQLDKIFLPAAGTAAVGPVNVTTHHYNKYRNGANLQETILNANNVNVRQFGKLFSRPVDGFIYAQPLYAAQISIPSQGVRNVVYVATEHDSVYAFDADDPAASDPLWQVSLGTPIPSTDISTRYRDLVPEIGITSTPVIDLASRTIYVVAKSKDLAQNTYHQRLHALALDTGEERPGSPVEITASLPGTGAGSAGGTLSLDPLLNMNRPGLLLLNGVVYIGFGSHGGNGNYHGWLLGYDAKTLAQVARFVTTPDAEGGSIWQSGQGLVADDNNNIYVVTGNGPFTVQNGGRDYGDCALKFSTANGLSLVDYFTPHNTDVLNDLDIDLGSGGPVLLPEVNRLIFTGKDTVFRVLNTNKLGGFDPQTDHLVQQFQASTRRMFSAPVYWDSPNNGPVIYYWAGGDTLKVFKLVNGQFAESPVAQSTVTNVTGISNAAPMALSADGNKAGTGIVWATGPTSGDANQQTVPGIVRAFDATDVSKELWNSQQNADRDDVGNYAKFCPPVAANGKVYVATFSGQLQVFGLLSNLCTFSLGQTSQLAVAGGDGGSVNINTGADCDWLATTNDSWIAITSDADGSGSGTISFSVDANPDTGMRTGAINIAGQNFTITQAGAAAVVSAASYDSAQLASDSIAVAWGANLATGTALASTNLPTSLGGASIKIKDSTGAERLAPLFFASPNQINYLIPSGTALGAALITVNSTGGNIATDTVQIAQVAPGLFSADGTGRGLAAAVVLRVKADGKQSYEPIGQFDPAQLKLVAVPIDLGPDLGGAGDQVFLILFGTGLRNRSSLANVKAQIGNIDVSPAFAGAQGDLLGLDQINLLLPRNLAGRGKVDVALTVDGLTANGVSVSMK